MSGDGYFQVTDGDITFFTRAGNFYLDSQGDIVNSDGLRLVGTGGMNIPTTAQSFSIGADGTISYIDQDGDLETAGVIQLANFANAEGLTKAGDNLYLQSTNSGVPQPQTPGNGGTGTLVAGTLEMSNVDLSEEFTEMIVAKRGFQANTRIITTSDEILQELVNLKR
ncbi:hypothetical protein B4N84_12150 [Flavobacterium sp. IR1]|nr:hypothetical protein B4N84_12150 [Flavobacterium sp. IR1]